MKTDDIRGPLFKMVIAIVTVILLGVVVNLFLQEGLWEFVKEHAQEKWQEVTSKPQENKQNVVEIEDASMEEKKQEEAGEPIEIKQDTTIENTIVEINVQDYQNNANLSIYE